MLLYLAWIVGYVINPQVAAHGIASELAVRGQPHSRVFLISDIINFGVILIISLMMVRMNNSLITRRVAFFYTLFGLATLLSTYFSLLCAPSVQQCVMNGETLQRTAVHYSLGIIAGVALFFAALNASKLLDENIRIVFKKTLIIAAALGVTSIVFSLMPLNSVVIALFQRIYLLMLAMYIFVIPFIISQRPLTK